MATKTINKSHNKEVKTITVNPEAKVVTVVCTHKELKLDTIETAAGKEIPAGIYVEEVPTKSIVKTSENDEFDPYIGVALAMAYEQFGSRTQFRKFVDETATFVKAKKTK